MRVWVNTVAGWIQHGQVRVSPKRAEEVARILARRYSWETAAGAAPPPLRAAKAGAPSPSVAAKSPAKGPSLRIKRPPDEVHRATSTPWSRREVEAVVEDYFGMLVLELKGELVNKAEHNRRLKVSLDERSRGSLEFKHQNISAILLELGYPYVSGYKPRRNYQDLLRTVVIERLASASQLRLLAAAAVEAQVEAPPVVGDLLALLVDPPRPVLAPRASYERRRQQRTTGPVFVNWLEQEARNRSLADAGEELALQFEHRRLWQEKRRGLAERVEHVSRTRGDGLGFDILSFESNGAERLIEVKTTRFGPMTPFFASRNEVAVSEERASAYYLYRLFAFGNQPRMFHLHGFLGSTCILEPVQYAASVM